MMTNKVIIVGCSGLGREVAWLAKRNGLEVVGFLDDNTSLRGQSFEAAEVLGGIGDADRFLSYDFIVAIANPVVRFNIVSDLSLRGIRFRSLIDKDAIIGSSSLIGEGCIVFPRTIITVNCSIGRYCIINKGCSIGHDASIESFSTLAPLVMLGGHVRIGSQVDIGASACVRQGLDIIDRAVVGMGSVVVKSLSEKAIVAGNPAKILRLL